MEFKEFKTAVQKRFVDMRKHEVFRMGVDKDQLWERYLSSFPEGSNPMFRERTEHDCNCCKNFIRQAGAMVAIVDGTLVSIWDVTVGGAYQVVADALSEYVKNATIENVYLHFEPTVGVDKNFELKEGVTRSWEHFFLQLPPELYASGASIGTKLGDYQSTKDVLHRALAEISMDSIDTVLELIAQKSLYRGDEHTASLTAFKKLKKEFDALLTPMDRDVFCWSKVKKTPPSISRIRSTVIGTLLVDLSEGRELEYSVKAFEGKVAPTNYKRPTALVTKAMVDSAKAKLSELGLESALVRRYATLSDMTINNVLFADHSAKKAMGSVFDEIATKGADTKNLDKVEDVSIETFMESILPKAESVEILLENRHSSNLVSLIAPCDLTAKNLFKWGNPFSWSYAGEVADSMKENVKAAGGKVDGVLRFSIQWSGDMKDNSDLDAHCVEPSGHIYFSNPRVQSGGNLDVDITQPVSQKGTTPSVENITWPTLSRMRDGIYKFYVNQYRAQSSKGFSAEIEFDGQIFSYEYPRAVTNNVQIAEVTLKNGVFSIKHILDSTASVKQVWGIPTQTFHKVSTVMLSPNYWDDKAVGNKHYFFMIDGCINEGQARGFYNEFLTSELDQHRKVFEIVGSKMMTEETNNQLSGVGFSSTQRNSILCRVKGSFSRVVKITF